MLRTRLAFLVPAFSDLSGKIGALYASVRLCAGLFVDEPATYPPLRKFWLISGTGNNRELTEREESLLLLLVQVSENKI